MVTLKDFFNHFDFYVSKLGLSSSDFILSTCFDEIMINPASDISFNNMNEVLLKCSEYSTLLEEEQLSELWKILRYERDNILRCSDWVVSVIDSNITEEEKTQMIEYREKLRQLPSVSDDPRTIDFPQNPLNDKYSFGKYSNINLARFKSEYLNIN